MDKVFMEDVNEIERDVHLMSPNWDNEVTLCGCRVENGISGDLRPTKETVVTCSLCIMEILACRNVKILEGWNVNS